MAVQVWAASGSSSEPGRGDGLLRGSVRKAVSDYPGEPGVTWNPGRLQDLEMDLMKPSTGPRGKAFYFEHRVCRSSLRTRRPVSGLPRHVKGRSSHHRALETQKLPDPLELPEKLDLLYKVTLRWHSIGRRTRGAELPFTPDLSILDLRTRRHH